MLLFFFSTDFILAIYSLAGLNHSKLMLVLKWAVTQPNVQADWDKTVQSEKTPRKKISLAVFNIDQAANLLLKRQRFFFLDTTQTQATEHHHPASPD